MTVDATITDFGRRGKESIPDTETLDEARQAYRKMKEERERKKALKVKI